MTDQSKIDQLRKEKAEIQEAFKGVLACLVASISILFRSNTENTYPSQVVASNKMFNQMMRDYRNAVEHARSVLEKQNDR